MIAPNKLPAGMAILAILTACGGGGGGGSGSSAGGGAPTQSLTASGQVTDASNGAVISGAQVDIPLRSSDPTGDSGTDGKYSLSLPNNGVPQFLVATVNKDGYLPGTLFFKYDNGQLQPLTTGSNNAALVPIQIKDVVFLNGLSVTHLGDGDFGGTAYSQLQVPLSTVGSGLLWDDDSFTLTSTQRTSYNFLTVSLYARGVKSGTPKFYRDQIVLGNSIDPTGKVTGETQSLKVSAADGSFTQISHTFLLNSLAADAVAHLQIISGKQCGNTASDYDDFEIVSVTGELS